jgi:hypothetical protein
MNQENGRIFMKNKKNKNSSVFLEGENNIANESSIEEEDLSQGIDIVNRNREELETQRSERINKFKRNASGQMIERPKIRYKINTRGIIIILVIIIIVSWILYDYGPIFGIDIKNVSTNIDDYKIELVTKESDIYGEYNDELFVYSNNSITTYNELCEVTWTHSFSDSFSPNIYVEGKYMLVTNNSTGMMYLFENHNEILNKKIDGTIKNAFLDKYGNMAIEYSVDSGYKNIIGVYNKKGNSLYDAYLSQENVISLKMLDNAQKIIFSEAVTDSSTIGIKFREIDISKKDDEKIKDIISIDNKFVYDFNVEGKQIYALLNNEIVSININSGDITVLKEFNDTQMIFVSLNDNYYTYLERSSEDNVYVAENISYNGNKISSTTFDSVPKNMISSNFVNYYIYQDHVNIINKWGVDLGQRSTNFTPKKCIVFNNNKSLALIYTNKIYIINL